MAALTSVSALLNTASGIKNAIPKELNLYRDYNDIKGDNEYALQSYKEVERDNLEKAKLDQTRMAADSAEESRKRQQALKRAVASQQARFGAQGIDTTNGSGEAVLLGLYQESDEEKSYRDRLQKIREDSLKQDIESRSRRNLLSLQNTYRKNRNNMYSSLNNYF